MPLGGPAGWDKVCAPGVMRMPCQAKARVTVGIVSHAQAQLLFILSPAPGGAVLVQPGTLLQSECSN